MPGSGDKKRGSKERSSSFRRSNEPNSFLAQNPFNRLIGDIFELSADQLCNVLKRLNKLRAFSLNCGEEENSGKLSEEEYDAERLRWAQQLNHLNRELLAAISDLFLLRKEVLDARHHVEMAELERSVGKS